MEAYETFQSFLLQAKNEFELLLKKKNRIDWQGQNTDEPSTHLEVNTK